MPKAKEELAPIRQSVLVDCPIEDAFRLFAEGFGEWWPLASDAGIEPWVGGRVFERSPAGEEKELGEITAWEPPARIEFTWGDRGQRVDVEFCVVADGTRVTLIHTGWESSAQIVMRSFAEFVCQVALA